MRGVRVRDATSPEANQNATIVWRYFLFGQDPMILLAYGIQLGVRCQWQDNQVVLDSYTHDLSSARWRFSAAHVADSNEANIEYHKLAD